MKRASGGVGVKLREARERRNVSLRQIADSTKISVSYLEALERDDISRLPGGLFSRSFVRSYAIEVGLNPEQLVDAFLEQFPGDLVAAGHPTTTRLEQEHEHEQVNGKGPDGHQPSAVIWMALLGAPLVGGLVYFGVAQPGSTTPETAVIARAQPSVLPSIEIQPVAMVLEHAEVSAGPFGVREGAADVRSIGALPPETSKARAPVQDDAAVSVSSGELTVDLRATAPCWVSAVVDGERVISREFETGEQQTVVVHAELVLTLGDASALAVAFNGVNAKPLGGVGQIVTTNITPDNFQHLLPTQ